MKNGCATSCMTVSDAGEQIANRIRQQNAFPTHNEFLCFFTSGAVDMDSLRRNNDLQRGDHCSHDGRSAVFLAEQRS